MSPFMTLPVKVRVQAGYSYWDIISEVLIYLSRQTVTSHISKLPSLMM